MTWVSSKICVIFPRTASGAAQVLVFFPDVGETLGLHMEHCMQIAFPIVLVSTRDFGRTRYIPRNLGLL
jgi:hypothetical protein